MATEHKLKKGGKRKKKLNEKSLVWPDNVSFEVSYCLCGCVERLGSEKRLLRLNFSLYLKWQFHFSLYIQWTCPHSNLKGSTIHMLSHLTMRKIVEYYSVRNTKKCFNQIQFDFSTFNIFCSYKHHYSEMKVLMTLNDYVNLS